MLNEKYNLEVDTYRDIDNLTVDELLTRIERDFGFSSKAPFNLKKQCNLMRRLCEWFSLNPCNEQLMFMMVNKHKVLCEAVAGSGKTTISQLRLIRYKVFEQIKGYDILCIAYNEHAVHDMVNRHRDLAYTLNSKKIKGLHIDEDIFCRTFHSYCLMWVKEYKFELGMSKSGEDISILKDTEETILMKKAITVVFKDTPLGDKIEYNGALLDKITSSCISLYANMRESMTPPDEMYNLTQFYEIDTMGDGDLASKVQVLKQVFEKYQKVKKFKSRYDFTDILQGMYRLVTEIPEARERIQNAYPVVLVDEFQDFTTLMREILKNMVKEETYLTCVGDGDQSIYSFRGADSLNCIKFRNEFKDSLIVTMGKNRRCRSNIINIGRKVIETNKLRNRKIIKPVKEGGTIVNQVYVDLADQYDYIIKELKAKIEEHKRKSQLPYLADICICYRNKDNSTLLTNRLLKENIPFTIGSGTRPFQDKLDKDYMDLLYMLKIPDDKELIKSSLFKVLPALTKKECDRIVNELTDYTNFYDIQFPEYLTKVLAFQKSLAVLKGCALKMKAKANMSEYMPALIQLHRNNYWTFVSKNINYSIDLENEVKSQYIVDLTFGEFIENRRRQIERLDDYDKTRNGVYITTFHGLKGLEFNEVYVVDLADNIFPNFKENENYSYTEEVKQCLKEECTSLFYVVCTRAKDKITFMWNKDNPSYYKQLVDLALFESKLPSLPQQPQQPPQDEEDDFDDFELELEDDEDALEDLAFDEEEEFELELEDEDLASEETNVFGEEEDDDALLVNFESHNWCEAPSTASEASKGERSEPPYQPQNKAKLNNIINKLYRR